MFFFLLALFVCLSACLLVCLFALGYGSSHCWPPWPPPKQRTRASLSALSSTAEDASVYISGAGDRCLGGNIQSAENRTCGKSSRSGKLARSASSSKHARNIAEKTFFGKPWKKPQREELLMDLLRDRGQTKKNLIFMIFMPTNSSKLMSQTTQAHHLQYIPSDPPFKCQISTHKGSVVGI